MLSKRFEQGWGYSVRRRPEKAVVLLRQAAERDPENPYHLSYYGLSLAAAERKWEEAERLCHTAVCRARRQAQLYLNLAEVYLASDRRQAAADTLARGLHYLPHESGSPVVNLAGSRRGVLRCWASCLARLCAQSQLLGYACATSCYTTFRGGGGWQFEQSQAYFNSFNAKIFFFFFFFKKKKKIRKWALRL